jgi:hypothetical protein
LFLLVPLELSPPSWKLTKVKSKTKADAGQVASNAALAAKEMLLWGQFERQEKSMFFFTICILIT